MPRPGDYQHVAMSPDGKRILLTALEGANQDIWVLRSTAGRARRG